MVSFQKFPQRSFDQYQQEANILHADLEHYLPLKKERFFDIRDLPHSNKLILINAILKANKYNQQEKSHQDKLKKHFLRHTDVELPFSLETQWGKFVTIPRLMVPIRYLEEKKGKGGVPKHRYTYIDLDLIQIIYFLALDIEMKIKDFALSRYQKVPIHFVDEADWNAFQRQLGHQEHPDLIEQIWQDRIEDDIPSLSSEIGTLNL